MAEPEAHPTQGANIDEAFVADRQKFWSSFTSFTTFAVVAVIVLLILMAIFLL